MSADQWSDKQIQFAHAMQRYENNQLYFWFNKFVSLFNVTIQLSLLVYSFTLHLGLTERLLAFLLAFVLADFINGLAHLIMDHNAHYSSIAGPLIAAFHLHHDTPRYNQKPLWQVYVDESGFKVWLVFYLATLLFLSLVFQLPHFLQVLLINFAVLSSLAEVSHYLCHNNQSRFVKTLQRVWIILPKQHHMKHHKDDNVNYAFLNGMTDPVINIIASVFYHGYRDNTDQHVNLYKAQRQAQGLSIR